MKQYDVAAYVWPSFTGDEPRTRLFWPEGIGEWQSIHSAEKKFPEHDWPRRPLWGYVNEANPDVMEMEIEAASSHGVNVFIYDWYWYDGRPFLEQCLDNGFLKARNRNKMRFYVMWANHDGPTFWDKRLSDNDDTVIWGGAVNRTEFDRVTDRVIEKYFSQENYYKINGAPVFCVYFLQNLVKGLGGIDETAEALEDFRRKTKAAGFPDLHLQLILRGELLSETGVDVRMDLDMVAALQKIRFDSATHYQMLGFTDMGGDYAKTVPDAIARWKAEQQVSLYQYYPHLSLGWDNNPRTHKLMPTVCRNATPENVEKMLRAAKAHVDEYDLQPPLITVNSWNEWTETSYLEPDNLYGYGYLDAVKKVFLEEK